MLESFLGLVRQITLFVDDLSGRVIVKAARKKVGHYRIEGDRPFEVWSMSGTPDHSLAATGVPLKHPTV